MCKAIDRIECLAKESFPKTFLRDAITESNKTSDRQARVFVALTSTNYCASPLVQESLRISCRMEIHMPPTMKNKELIQIVLINNESHVDILYYQREEVNVAGSFVSEEVPVSGQQRGDTRKRKKKNNNKERKTRRYTGCREFFCKG